MIGRIRALLPKTLRGWACAVVALDIAIFVLAFGIVLAINSPAEIRVENGGDVRFEILVDGESHFVLPAETIDLPVPARGAPSQEIAGSIGGPHLLGFVLRDSEGLGGLTITVNATSGSGN